MFTANLSAEPTSVEKKHPDAFSDRRFDVGTDRQPIGNGPDSTGEPKEKVTSQLLEKVKDQNPNITSSATLSEIQTLAKSSTNDRELILNKNGDLRTPIRPLLTSLRTVPVISHAGTSEAQSFERSERQTVTLSDTLIPNLTESVMRKRLGKALSETPTIPNTSQIDMSKYVKTSDLEAIFDSMDRKFLEVLAIGDCQIHENLL